MEVTAIEIIPARGAQRVRGYCTLTLDNEFVIKEVKIIEGPRGLFVAMPTDKVTTRSGCCGGKNAIDASYCNWCGCPVDTAGIEEQKSHTDVAHPITRSCRTSVENAVLAAFRDSPGDVGPAKQKNRLPN